MVEWIVRPPLLMNWTRLLIVSLLFTAPCVVLLYWNPALAVVAIVMWLSLFIIGYSFFGGALRRARRGDDIDVDSEVH